MQLARIKGDPEKKEVLVQHQPTAVLLQPPPSFLLHPPHPAACTAGSQIESRVEGIPERVEGKNLGARQNWAWMDPFLLHLPGLSSLPMPIILAQYSQQGTKSFANGQHWQCLLPTGQGQKSTFLELRRLRKVEGCGF